MEDRKEKIESEGSILERQIRETRPGFLPLDLVEQEKRLGIFPNDEPKK
jgi:hypothetical protein